MCPLLLLLLCIVNLSSVTFLSYIPKTVENIERTKALLKKSLHVPYVGFV